MFFSWLEWRNDIKMLSFYEKLPLFFHKHLLLLLLSKTNDLQDDCIVYIIILLDWHVPNIRTKQIKSVKAWLVSSGVTRQRRPALGAYAHRSAATLAGESRAPAWCPNTPARLHPSTLSHESPGPAREYSGNYHNSQWLLFILKLGCKIHTRGY